MASQIEAPKQRFDISPPPFVAMMDRTLSGIPTALYIWVNTQDEIKSLCEGPGFIQNVQHFVEEAYRGLSQNYTLTTGNPGLISQFQQEAIKIGRSQAVQACVENRALAYTQIAGSALITTLLIADTFVHFAKNESVPDKIDWRTPLDMIRNVSAIALPQLLPVFIDAANRAIQGNINSPIDIAGTVLLTAGTVLGAEKVVEFGWRLGKRIVPHVGSLLKETVMPKLKTVENVIYSETLGKQAIRDTKKRERAKDIEFIRQARASGLNLSGHHLEEKEKKLAAPLAESEITRMQTILNRNEGRRRAHEVRQKDVSDAEQQILAGAEGRLAETRFQLTKSKIRVIMRKLLFNHPIFSRPKWDVIRPGDVPEFLREENKE